MELTAADIEYQHRNKDTWRHFRKCSVYLIQGEKTGLVKIGIAESPETRLSILQAHSPDTLHILKAKRFANYTEAEHKERELHRRFASDRTHGEWFRPENVIPAFDGLLNGTALAIV